MYRYILILCAALLLSSTARAEEDSRESILRALKDELRRSATLKLPNAEQPYYVSYTVVDSTAREVVAEYGGLVEDDSRRSRDLHVDLRVGDPGFDNSGFGGFSFSRPRALTLDGDYDVLRRQIWLATDGAYKDAVETLEKKRAALSNQSRDSDVLDFSEVPAIERTIEAKEAPTIDAKGLATRLSSHLRGYSFIHEGGVIISMSTSTRYFVDTAGSVVVKPESYVRVSVVCRTQADDGMNLMNYDSVATALSDLPSEAELGKMVHAVAKELEALRGAPGVEDYSGPVLFEGTAAGQVMQHLLAAHVGGTPAAHNPDLARMPAQVRSMMQDSSAFAGKMGKAVLPASFSVVDDPTATASDGKPLLGSYAVDDEGVEAKRTELIKKGRLVGFLMSRRPREDFPRSTGHGRGTPGSIRAQPGNLIVSSSGGLNARAMRARLLREAAAAGEDYALIVRRLDDSSVTSTYSRGGGNAAMGLMAMMRGGGEKPSIPQPLVVARLNKDGSEELVRGATLSNLSPRALRSIVATGKERTVHNYFVSGVGGFGGGLRMVFVIGGALPSARIPTSVTTPILLFKDVDVREAGGATVKPPAIPRPVVESASH